MLAFIVLGLLASPSVRERVAHSEVSLIVTYTATAAGAAAAVLVGIAGRLARHRRAEWISAALALYSVVVVPFATVETATELVAYWTVVALLILAIRPPPAVGGSAGWVLAGCGLLLTLTTAEVATLAPGDIPFPRSSTLAHVVSVITACALVAALTVNGWQRKGPLRRMGHGLLVLALAHLYWIASGAPSAEPNSAFSMIRLCGVALVLLAAIQLARRVWCELQVEHSEKQTALDVGVAHLQRVAREAAERDHELRNGLAGLAGIDLLLERSLDREDSERLRHAVMSELSRLTAMLERPRPDARHESYLIAPVLTDLVMLRQSAGLEVELDVDEQLRVSGSPEVLAQVVTNLMANCERHASGSVVRIRASRDQDRVHVEVTDDGPGIAPGLRRSVLDSGVHGSRTGGRGLGLHICRRLLEAEGGALRMLAPCPAQTGCAVLVELPAVLDLPPPLGR